MFHNFLRLSQNHLILTGNNFQCFKGPVVRSKAFLPSSLLPLSYNKNYNLLT